MFWAKYETAKTLNNAQCDAPHHGTQNASQSTYHTNHKRFA